MRRGIGQGACRGLVSACVAALVSVCVAALVSARLMTVVLFFTYSNGVFTVLTVLVYATVFLEFVVNSIIHTVAFQVVCVVTLFSDTKSVD